MCVSVSESERGQTVLYGSMNVWLLCALHTGLCSGVSVPVLYPCVLGEETRLVQGCLDTAAAH